MIYCIPSCNSFETLLFDVALIDKAVSDKEA